MLFLKSDFTNDDVNRIAFLEQHGFHYRDDFAEVNTKRSLEEPIPESRLPDGYRVREVSETGEIPNRASVQREVWLPWKVGNVSDDDYAHFMQLPGYYRDLDISTGISNVPAIQLYGSIGFKIVNRCFDYVKLSARQNHTSS